MSARRSTTSASDGGRKPAMKLKRSHALVVLLGLGVTGAVGISAASLGGLRADDLGADADVVASCDSDGLDVSFTTSVVAGTPEVSAVTLGDVAAACDGQTVDVTLFDGAGAALGSGSGTAGTAGSVTVSVSADAEAVEGVAVVISG
jgi:hypothetical protein